MKAEIGVILVKVYCCEGKKLEIHNKSTNTIEVFQATMRIEVKEPELYDGTWNANLLGNFYRDVQWYLE
jgi:hypothetical protein